MLDMMEECDMLSNSQTGEQLINPFTNIPATPEQMHDLLKFRQIGQAEFEDHVSYRILHTPSTDAPRRRKRLQTFSTTKTTKRKLKQIDRDRKTLQTCFKKQLVVLARGEQLPPECSSYFIPCPCALSDPDGLPHKGNKSKATDFFETRYKKFNVIVSNFPGAWTPQSVILEGMFLIQTAPPPGISTFREYTDMLLTRFVQPHLRAGALEVHIIFDDPGTSHQSPKEIERQKRDNVITLDSDHECLQIKPHASLPTDWRRKLLNCRRCKRALCAFLSHEMLHLIPSNLRDNQIFFTAGGFLDQHQNQCYCIRKDGEPHLLPYLRSNAEETDLRIWLHCVNSTGSIKKDVVFSRYRCVQHWLTNYATRSRT